MAKKKFIDYCNSLPYVLSALLLLNLMGALIFSIVEDVSYSDSFYWAWITSLSIGYGDMSPETEVGQLTAIVLGATVLLVIVPLLVASVVMKVIKDRNEFSHEEQEEIKNLLREIKERA